MATINSLGVASGVLTSDLIDKIVAAERQATDQRVTAQKGEVNTKLTAIGSVRSALDKVASTVADLNNPTSFGATSASVADAGIAASEVTRAILERFRASGIQIPFPQREVRLLQGAGPAG